MKKSILTLSVLLTAGFAMAQDNNINDVMLANSVREDYQREQALAEVPRLVKQFEILVQNYDEIGQRLVKLEAADHTAGLRAELDALRAEIAELRVAVRREQDAMRQEIVRDLAARMQKLIPPPASAPAPVPIVAQPTAPARVVQALPPPPPTIGPHYEYVVQPGQTLSYIAKGFDTTVAKILAANPKIKANALRPGQKLIIPAEDKPAPGKKTVKRR